MKKIITLLLTIVIGATLMVGCNESKENGELEENKSEVTNKDVKVVVPDGLPAISLAKLAKENPEIKSGYNINYSIESTSDALSTVVMKEEADIAIVPSNMAAIAYNKTSNYKILGTVGMGSFYLVSTENMSSMDDLIGKEVGNTGKGLTPDITVKTILKEKNINLDDINFNYVNSMSELVPMMASGKLNTGFVSEPALTGLMNKNDNIKIITSLNDEWKSISGSKNGYPQSTLIVKSDFAKENPEFIEKFVEQISDSIKWANDNPTEAGSYSKDFGVSTEASVIEKAMERANLNFINISDMKEEYENYYKILFDFEAKTVGGKLPDEGILYKGE